MAVDLPGGVTRLRVGDQTGRILAELTGEIDLVSWRLNDVGRLRFQLKTGDPKTTRTNLQYGNRVYLQFDNGLPDWGGMIDPPRDWLADKSLQITAYSGEYILDQRQTDKGRYFNDQTIGTIFRAVIEEADAIRDMGISVGTVWAGGDGHYPEYHFKSLLEIIRDSLCDRLESAEFVLVPTVSSGVISFTANLYEARGEAKPNVVLIEGHNLTYLRRLEQGIIANSWDIAGGGVGWGDDRLTASAEDDASVLTFGFRQRSRNFPDTVIQATLDNAVAGLLSEHKDPKNIWELRAISKKPAQYADYDVGDTVRLLAPNYDFEAFDGNVKILAREYSPASGECTLVVREV